MPGTGNAARHSGRSLLDNFMLTHRNASIRWLATNEPWMLVDVGNLIGDLAR